MEKLNCELRSWEDMRDLSEKVAKQIIDSGYEPDFIIGITRGGWVPSVNLSDLLDVKDLLAIRVEHWGITATKSGKAELKFPLNMELSGKKILLVDDLTDTGESISVCIEHLKRLNAKEVKTATLIHKSNSNLKPDFYAEEVKEWKWIIFPWNLTEDLSNLVGKVMEEKNIQGIGEVKCALQESFELEVSRETVEEILERIKK